MFRVVWPVLFLVLALLLTLSGCAPAQQKAMQQMAEVIALPAPVVTGQTSLEDALAGRRSSRSFAEQPLTLEALGQLLWAMQGQAVDARTGATRTAPSAGATHPLSLYVVVTDVAGLEAGIYYYVQHEHGLRLEQAGEFAAALAEAALNQTFMDDAAVNIVVAADFARTTGRYGERGRRYVYMEVGHATQNLLLQAEALGLKTVAVGAFHDYRVAELLATRRAPLMIIPTGN